MMHTRDLVHNLGWWINIRWLAGISVLVATFAAGNLLGLQLAVVPLYTLGIGILMYNFLFKLAWERLRHETAVPEARAHRLAHLQVAADWAVMTSLIHFSGGIESPAVLYFFFHIALAAIELSSSATYWYAALVSVLVGGMALLEYAGILPHVPVGGFLTARLYQHPGYVGGVLFFFNSTVFVIAYLAVGTTRRLRRREAEIVALYEQLSQLDREKSRFILTVTHELRSPVGVVRSLLRTMLSGYSGSMPAAQHEIVARALHRADFLQTLIDDLLDLAAGKSRLRTPEQPEPVQLNHAVERVAKRFQIPSQERHIRLEWRSECEDQAGPITILATDAGVDRVLNNLVSNAVKYTPEGGRVSVTLHRENGNACVQVSDTGIGIPEEAMPHLFEEFYRAPNAKALEKEGTGLGLTITRDLIAHYDGRITVQSRAGQGTTFTVIWPTMRDA